MCEPVTIIAGISAVATLAGGVKAKNAAKKQGAEAARQGQFNQQMAEYAAMDAERRGQMEAGQVMRSANTMKGEQRAAAAASGVTAGYGTLAEAATQTDFFAALDTNTVLDNAGRDAWTARTQGVEAMRAGRAGQAQANAAANAILLNTSVSLAGKWYGAVGSGGAASTPSTTVPMQPGGGY